MMTFTEYMASMALPLPEQIRKLKDAGRLRDAERALDARLAMDLPVMLRHRLLTEKERLRRTRDDYPFDEQQAFLELQKVYPELDEKTFWQLDDEGLMDFLFFDGVKRYHVRFAATLRKDSLIKKRFGHPVDSGNDWLDSMIQTLRTEGTLSRRITLEAQIAPSADVFRPGTWRAWLPVPLESDQQSAFQVLSGQPDSIGDAHAPARSAYWERESGTLPVFSLRYRYISTIRYADPLHAPVPACPLYPCAAPPCDEDLAEDGVFIRFTPYLRALARTLTEGVTEPVEKAWRFYCFVTQKVRYAFVRQYFLLDDLGEYCALNLRGDCGLQALLFIILCRISGIPARWQSGLSMDEDYTGAHDWAQFYLEGWGWLFADPSYGGSAWRCGAADRHAFYFGNIDPMRMAANRQFMAPLTPQTHQFRHDPYDQQSGEIESPELDCALLGKQIDDDVSMIGWETLPAEGNEG